MSEYWKSTPKYWCKFCRVYVRDTKTDKLQHDATGRHQSNVQRSLRNLHRDNERQDRDKQRAKDEVARLNSLVSSSEPSSSTKPTSSAPPEPSSTKPHAPPPSAPRQATLDDRKLQMKQLADMGVAIPDQFRADLALPGQWETVSETPIRSNPQPSDNPALSYGIRKRKITDHDEEALGNDNDNDDAIDNKRKADWGARYRLYPASTKDASSSTQEIEALLNPQAAAATPKSGKEQDQEERKEGDEVAVTAQDTVKLELEEANPSPVVFKKRRPKAAKVS